jgi:hypothetical protein
MKKSKRTITGPGAADFLASGSGEDLPGTSPAKGTGNLRDDSDLTDARNLVPRLGPDDEAEPGERDSILGPTKDDHVSGSQTGTIGGGGPRAHKREE